MTSRKLGVALAVLLSATSVAFAQASIKGPEDAAPAPSRSIRHSGEHARRLYFYAPSGLEQGQSSAPQSSAGETAREAALHDCSVKASKWSFRAWETTQLAVYRDCMTAHDQVE
jgi:hypothetical protein